MAASTTRQLEVELHGDFLGLGLAQCPKCPYAAQVRDFPRRGEEAGAAEAHNQLHADARERHIWRGMFIAAVNGNSMYGLPYPTVVHALQRSPRPLRITFLQWPDGPAGAAGPAETLGPSTVSPPTSPPAGDPAGPRPSNAWAILSSIGRGKAAKEGAASTHAVDDQDLLRFDDLPPEGGFGTTTIAAAATAVAAAAATAVPHASQRASDEAAHALAARTADLQQREQQLQEAREHADGLLLRLQQLQVQHGAATVAWEVKEAELRARVLALEEEKQRHQQQLLALARKFKRLEQQQASTAEQLAGAVQEREVMRARCTELDAQLQVALGEAAEAQARAHSALAAQARAEEEAAGAVAKAAVASAFAAAAQATAASATTTCAAASVQQWSVQEGGTDDAPCAQPTAAPSPAPAALGSLAREGAVQRPRQRSRSMTSLLGPLALGTTRLTSADMSMRSGMRNADSLLGADAAPISAKAAEATLAMPSEGSAPTDVQLSQAQELVALRNHVAALQKENDALRSGLASTAASAAATDAVAAAVTAVAARSALASRSSLAASSATSLRLPTVEEADEEHLAAAPAASVSDAAANADTLVAASAAIDVPPSPLLAERRASEAGSAVLDAGADSDTTSEAASQPTHSAASSPGAAVLDAAQLSASVEAASFADMRRLKVALASAVMRADRLTAQLNEERRERVTVERSAQELEDLVVRLKMQLQGTQDTADAVGAASQRQMPGQPATARPGAAPTAAEGHSAATAPATETLNPLTAVSPPARRALVAAAPSRAAGAQQSPSPPKHRSASVAVNATAEQPVPGAVADLLRAKAQRQPITRAQLAAAVAAVTGASGCLSGMLRKTSTSTNAIGLRAGWKTRWCKVEDGVLSYHANEKAAPKGVLSLFDPGVTLERPDVRTFVVCMDGGKRQFTFCSQKKGDEAAHEVDKWVSALQLVLDASARLLGSHPLAD